MAVPKRKQLHDDKPSTETQSSTRRATRHHPTTSTDEPPKQLRSGRTRAGDADTKPDVRPNKRKSDVYDEGSRPASREGARRTAVPPPSIPSSPEETARTRTAAPPTKLRATRNKTAETATAPVTSSQTWLNPLAVETPISPPKHPLQLQSEHASLPSPGAPIIQSHNALQAPNGVSRPVGAPQKIIRPVPKSSEKLPQSSVANSKATIKTTPKRQSRPLKPPSTPGPDRNIDKVFLGNICFRAWFPSYYPKEVLADTAGNAGEHPARGVGKLGGGKNAAPPPILERLLVCPCCFKYSRELPTWWDHIRYCERRAYVPGRKVYTHPRAGVRQPKTNAMKHDHEEAQGDAGSAGLEDGGEWSVWEVDGEKDGVSEFGTILPSRLQVR